MHVQSFKGWNACEYDGNLMGMHVQCSGMTARLNIFKGSACGLVGMNEMQSEMGDGMGCMAMMVFV